MQDRDAMQHQVNELQSSLVQLESELANHVVSAATAAAQLARLEAELDTERAAQVSEV